MGPHSMTWRLHVNGLYTQRCSPGFKNEKKKQYMCQHLTHNNWVENVAITDGVRPESRVHLNM